MTMKYCLDPRLSALLAFSMLTAALQASPEVPGEPQKVPVALVGGTIHPVTGPAIEAGTLLFDAGKIVALGTDLEIPDNATRVDCSGKHLYPGLFDAHSNLGLVEINSVRATVDDSETGDINPNVRAWTAVNPDSELIPVTRSNGVLLALTAPNGRLVSGRSAVIQLDGWTWEDMTIRTDVGLHLEWPLMSPFSEEFSDDSAKQQMEGREKKLELLKQAFRDARAYAQARSTDSSRQPIDARWESMIPVLQGNLPLIVNAEEVQQIQAAVAFARQQQVRLIIFGGYDAPHCAELLKENEVPVIVGGIYRLPRRNDDDYDASYTLPERLRQAGVSFCICSWNRFGASGVRNLPYHAATAAAHGLPVEEAVKAITIYPAKILGIDHQVGSLETGKDATLIVTTGNPLETETLVEAAYIQGRQVDLNDRHKRLWQKYQEKYRRLNAENAKNAE